MKIQTNSAVLCTGAIIAGVVIGAVAVSVGLGVAAIALLAGGCMLGCVAKEVCSLS